MKYAEGHGHTGHAAKRSATAGCAELPDDALDHAVGGGFLQSMIDGYREAAAERATLTPDQLQQVRAGNPLPRPR